MNTTQTETSKQTAAQNLWAEITSLTQPLAASGPRG